MYRNKIEDSQIEPSVQECMVKEDEPIKNAAKTVSFSLFLLLLQKLSDCIAAT